MRSRPRHRLLEPQRVVDAASDDEVLALLQACRNARDRFIVLALWRIGHRRGELTGVRLEDVHFVPDATRWAVGSRASTCTSAGRATVHRSFIHRHPDLHAAVLKAAADATTGPSPASAPISHRSLLAENANLHELNRRLAQQISDLEDRLSELLGQQAFDRSGLGAPAGTARIHA